MARNIKFEKLIQGGENPMGVTTQTVNGTEHWPRGGWNGQAFGSSPPDSSPERWERNAEQDVWEFNEGPGVLYTGPSRREMLGISNPVSRKRK